MRLNCGPTWAAAPVLIPDRTPVWRPRRAAIFAAVVLAAILGLAASPASADEFTPTIPQPVLVLNDCSATLSLVDLVPGRGYKIQVTDAAGAVVYSHSFVASDVLLDSFFEVPVGTHELRVSDVEDSSFATIRDVVVGPCTTDPATTPEDGPVISVTPDECNLLGATDVNVKVAGLASGTHSVGVAAGGEPIEGVADATVTSDADTVVFSDLPNGASYLVWLKDPQGTVIASTTLELPVCDLPTLEEPQGEPGEESVAGSDKSGALASTGIPVAGVILGALGALQVGALVGGTALLRGRGRGGHRGSGDALLG